MLDKKEIRIGVLILNLLCIAYSLFLCIKTFFAETPATPERLITALLLIVALGFALIYGLKGGKKKDARLYKVFCWLYLLAMLATFVTLLLGYIAVEHSILLLVIFAGISVLCIAVLTLGKNLGKTWSYALCAINFACAPIMAVFALLMQAQSAGVENLVLVNLDLLFSMLTLSAILGLANYFKYDDKIARGRKV